MLQFAKLSGFSPIITTASPSHESFLKARGATHVIDRSEPLSSLAATVRSITTEPVNVAYDAISYPDTQQAAYDILAPGGGLVVVLAPAIEKPEDGKFVVNVQGNVNGQAQRAVGKQLYANISRWLEKGDIKVRAGSTCAGGVDADLTWCSRTMSRFCLVGWEGYRTG